MARDHSRGLSALVALAAAGTIALAGCGTSRLLHHGSSHPVASSSTAAPGPRVPQAAVIVIRGWSNALRSGDVTAAARYFHLPSGFFAGSGPPLVLRTLAQAESANADLPCGAKLISTELQGHFVNALFRLTNRPGPGGTSGCGTGVGQTARVNFVVARGQILEWLRAPDQPGDNGTPRTTPTTPTSPGPAPNGATPIV